jgi:hypothetical protein
MVVSECFVSAILKDTEYPTDAIRARWVRIVFSISVERAIIGWLTRIFRLFVDAVTRVFRNGAVVVTRFLVPLPHAWNWPCQSCLRRS